MPGASGGGHLDAAGKKTAQAVHSEVQREVDRILQVLFQSRRKEGRFDLESAETALRASMYDEVWFDEELPLFPSMCRRFQTKSLERCLDRYIVTKAGRLCLAGNTLMEDSTGVLQPSSQSVDTNFHGDIRLISDDEEYIEYIARFTHGTLEWIRPMIEVREDPQLGGNRTN